MSRGAVIPSALDLTDAGNVIQARHELHQAMDFGGQAERARWAEKWGEAALAAGERASRESMEWDGFSAPRAVNKAEELVSTLRGNLERDEPDIKACRRVAMQLSDTVNTILEAYEE